MERKQIQTDTSKSHTNRLLGHPDCFTAAWDAEASGIVYAHTCVQSIEGCGCSIGCEASDGGVPWTWTAATSCCSCTINGCCPPTAGWTLGHGVLNGTYVVASYGVLGITTWPNDCEAVGSIKVTGEFGVGSGHGRAGGGVTRLGRGRCGRTSCVAEHPAAVGSTGWLNRTGPKARLSSCTRSTLGDSTRTCGCSSR